MFKAVPKVVASTTSWLIVIVSHKLTFEKHVAWYKSLQNGVIVFAASISKDWQNKGFPSTAAILVS